MHTVHLTLSSRFRFVIRVLHRRVYDCYLIRQIGTQKVFKSVLGEGFLSFSMIASHFLSKIWGVTRAKLLTKCQMFLLKSAPAPKHAMYVRCDVERARLAVRCGKCSSSPASTRFVAICGTSPLYHMNFVNKIVVVVVVAVTFGEIGTFYHCTAGKCS